MNRPDKGIEAPSWFQTSAAGMRQAADSLSLLMPLLRPIRVLLIINSSLLNLTPMSLRRTHPSS